MLVEARIFRADDGFLKMLRQLIERHLITVLDEYPTDNLLGAMVGEIHDEFRLNENDWLRQPDGTLIGKASLPIFSLERILGIDIDNEGLGLDEVESVGGLIMEKLGDIPKQGQKIEFPSFDIVIKKMNGPRIVLIKVIPQTRSHHDTDDQD